MIPQKQIRVKDQKTLHRLNLLEMISGKSAEAIIDELIESEYGRRDGEIKKALFSLSPVSALIEENAEPAENKDEATLENPE